MKEKTLLGAFASGAFTTLAFVAAALILHRTSPDVPAVTQSRGEASSSLLSSPLYCDARVRQTSNTELPRARLLYAAELNDARCYVRKSK